jgi:hypothetical protein
MHALTPSADAYSGPAERVPARAELVHYALAVGLIGPG